MTLRHSYAVHQLQSGINIREVQQSLGLESLETTFRYQHCIITQVDSPVDNLTTADIPEIPTAGVQLPFTPRNPIRYFTQWMKTRIKHGFRIIRESG
jgi:hypothetical protein